MKSLTLILIVAAFALTTACTDSEKVLPNLPDQNVDYLRTDDNGEVPVYQPNIKATNVSVEQAPNEEASFTDSRSDDDQTRADRTGGRHFGELLPASFLDCGTFIRKSDGTLLGVLNMQIPPAYAESGAKVIFGYQAELDLPSPCGIGTAVTVTYIHILATDVDASTQTQTNNTGTR